LCKERKNCFKKRSPQHNKPTNPNSKVPPQDAQLQGVVSMASIHNNQTQTVKFPPQDAQLQGVKQSYMQDQIKGPPRASAQL
jgi:hypothetical protein